MTLQFVYYSKALASLRITLRLSNTFSLAPLFIDLMAHSAPPVSAQTRISRGALWKLVPEMMMAARAARGVYGCLCNNARIGNLLPRLRVKTSLLLQ